MASILVIEDEANIARAVRDRLTREGHCVDAVLSGPAAFEFLRNHRPDLIILDVLMPDMDGFEVVKRLKADEGTQNVPVMLLTVLTEDERLKQHGVDAVLSKPYSGSELSRVVAGILARAAGGNHGNEKNPRS
ncbi:MAG TPA: response regulator [Candidatus Ozemobacteraceae bacterium]|nr:response regulator [Candidatus Ozemobacteraceae bacterium]